MRSINVGRKQFAKLLTSLSLLFFLIVCLCISMCDEFFSTSSIRALIVQIVGKWTKMYKLKFKIGRFDGKVNFIIWQSSVKDVSVQSDESKEMVDKTDVVSTSYSIKEKIENKNIEVREKKIKLVCLVKFNESLNLTHIYSHWACSGGTYLKMVQRWMSTNDTQDAAKQFMSR